MASYINTNVMSLNSQRHLNQSQSSMSTTLERLSSGLRINRAKDDAAGLAITQRFNSQITGLNQGQRNANDGISLVQTAEGALDEVSNSLQRMRELAVQAANGTYSSSDRNSLNDEVSALKSEITRISDATTFNGVKVIGSNTSVKLQVGYETNSTENMITATASDIVGMSGMVSVMAAGLTINTQASALAFISQVDVAVEKVSELRADFGAVQNRLESSIRNSANIAENQSAARSRIQDADFAQETASMTRSQILQQAGTAMLSQANQAPNGVLSLLG